MTMPLPATPPPSMPPPSGPPPGEKSSRRPSVEHIVLGAVLIAVVLGAAGWFLLKPGSSSPAAAPVVRPRVTAVATPAVTSSAAPKIAKSSTKPATKTLSKAAYLEAGNKICSRQSRQEAALGAVPTSTLQALAAYVRKEMAYNVPTVKALQALPAGASYAMAIHETYALMVTEDVQGTAMADALASGNRKVADALADKTAAEGDTINARLKAFGLKSCVG